MLAGIDLGSSIIFSRSALCSWIFFSVSMFFCAVSISRLKNRLPVFFADLGGFRSPGSSSDILLRVGRPVYVGAWGLGVGRPKLSSPIESESESELRTTCCPPDTIRLLAPELAEVCEVFGGRVSVDVITVSIIDASSIVEVFDAKDTAGPAEDDCVLCTRTAPVEPVELDGGETLSALLSAVADKISLRLQRVYGCFEAGAQYQVNCLATCVGHSGRSGGYSCYRTSAAAS